MKIYLAGPMRGYKDFNFPAFIAAAQMLRDMGHTVFNPAERDLERDGEEMSRSETGNIVEAEAKGFDRRVAIMDDLTYIIEEAEGIALLPGWEQSTGANAELWAAKFLELQVLFLVPEQDVVDLPNSSAQLDLSLDVA